MNNFSEENTKAKTATSNNLKPEESPRKFSQITSLLAKLNLKTITIAKDTQVSKEQISQQPKQSLSSHLPHINKTTITDFYERFNKNREKYQIIKTQKMDIKTLCNTNTEEIQEGQTSNNHESADSESDEIQKQQQEDEKHSIQFQFDESLDCNNSSNCNKIVDEQPSGGSHIGEGPSVSSISDDDNPLTDDISFQPTITSSIDWSLKAIDCSTGNRRIGDIGRSVSDNPNNNINNKKKYTLTDIGRSFSVANNDDDDDDDEDTGGAFVTINESNNSCPNPSSRHISSSILSAANSSNNNLMLATSVPVSPVLRNNTTITGGCSIEDERGGTSLAEKLKHKKLLLRDSSFQVCTFGSFWNTFQILF